MPTITTAMRTDANKMQVVFNIINMQTVIKGEDQNTDKKINSFYDKNTIKELYKIQETTIQEYNKAVKNQRP